jgi:hypothetical protein
MKFVERRPFAEPDLAARKLIEIANGVYIERVNAPFLAAGGTGDDFRAGIERAIASHFYFLLPSAKVGCHPAPFWLGAAAMTLTFFFLGFLASRLLLCWPLAMSISFGLRMTQTEMQNWPNS